MEKLHRFNRQDTGGQHEGIVFYDTPYAIDNEELNFRHAEGRPQSIRAAISKKKVTDNTKRNKKGNK